MNKKQRFRHSAEVKKHLKDRGVGYDDYRRGDRSGFYSDVDENTHLHVKDGKIGPAGNMHIVSVLSVVGLLLCIGLSIASLFLNGG